MKNMKIFGAVLLSAAIPPGRQQRCNRLEHDRLYSHRQERGKVSRGLRDLVHLYEPRRL